MVSDIATKRRKRPAFCPDARPGAFLAVVALLLLLQQPQSTLARRDAGAARAPVGAVPKRLLSSVDAQMDGEALQSFPQRQKGKEWSRRLPGTTTQLANVIKASAFEGEPVLFINGRSKAHVYRAVSAKAKSGVAIAKLWCMPDEFDLQDATQGHHYCSLDNARMTIQRMQALQRVTDECGLSDLAPRMWTERTVAEVPEKGYTVERHGLFQDLAPGVSFWGFTESASPESVLDLVGRVNSTQVVRGAIYDLLFTMCDRHMGNIFIDKDGNIKLIDNDQAFGMSDEKHEMCSLSSVFLPTTQCHAIAALGKDYAKRRRTWKDPEPPNPAVTLDYRCHAPGGTIGKNYPSTVGKCLGKLAAMRAETIKREYGFPTLVSAYHLKVRAWTMHHLGFEFALYRGAPQNPSCETFPKGPPCCRMRPAAPQKQRPPMSGESPPRFECEPSEGWKPDPRVPEACGEGAEHHQLGEDLSYAGVRPGDCRVCKAWADGWRLQGNSSAAFHNRIPDNAWEKWEDFQDREI